MKTVFIHSWDDDSVLPYQNDLLRMIQALDRQQAKYWKEGAGVDVYTDELLCTELADRWVDNTTIILATVDGKAIGFVEFSKDVHQDSSANWMSICYLYVDPEHRGKGYGKILVDLVRDIAKVARVDQLTLSVSKNNTSALRFYERIGFSEQCKYLSLKP